MQIQKIKINNFKAIDELEIEFNSMTAILGENNCGKSTIFEALEVFFDNAPKVIEEDFHFKDTSVPIEITVTFCKLVAGELASFGSAVVDGELTIKRTLAISGENNGTFQAYKKSVAEFGDVRAISKATDKRNKYNEIREQFDLPTATSAAAVEDNLKAWEEANPEKLELCWVRGFFGIDNVAAPRLKERTRLSLLRAVIDVNKEISDSKSSPIKKLLMDFTEQAIKNQTSVTDFIEEAKEKFSDLTDPTKIPKIGEISEGLTRNLRDLYEDAEMKAEWTTKADLSVTFPEPTVNLVDGDFSNKFESFGHGLQRAALLSVLLYLAENNDDVEAEGFADAQSDIILLIEEPEIYQHPQKQVVFRQVIEKLSRGFDKQTGIRMQVVFCTHSEKQVDFASFDDIRLLRKTSNGGKALHTCKGVSLDETRLYFAGLVNKAPMSREAFVAKMHIFIREVCEGFFAKKIILVEGVGDRAVLDAYYSLQGMSAEAQGIAIISVGSKSSLDKPFRIFTEFGIPCFVIFDNDEGENDGQANRLLQTVLGVDEPELVDNPSGVFSNFAAFPCKLERYLASETGDAAYNQAIQNVSDEFGLKAKDIKKTPETLKRVMLQLVESGVELNLFQDILAKVEILGVD